MSSAASSPSFDPELVDQTRQQLRGLVHEIEGLSRSDLAPIDFYAGFLNRVISALAAEGGAVWTLEEGQWQLAYQMNLSQTRLVENDEAQRRHGLLLQHVAASGQGTLIAPNSGGGEDSEASNPSEYLLVLGTLKSDKEVQGLVEIFQRPVGRPPVERGYLRFLLQMCELAGDYLKTRHLRLFADRQVMWTQLEQFTRLVHESLDLRQTAFTIANEGRRLIGCDRVSVALKHGKRCRIEAVSGQETMDTRSNTVVMLGELATVVVKGGEALWYTGDTTDLPPQIERAVEQYADEAHSKLITVLPLKRPQEEKESDEHEPAEYLGALIIEQITDDVLSDSMRRRIDVVGEHSAIAIANGREYHDLFLMPVWRAIGRAKWVVQARTLPKTLLIAGTIVIALLALFIIPVPFQLSGKGTLEPVDRRDVFATVDGVVDKVNVEHGQMVKKGQLLFVLRNTDLEVNISDVTGKLASTAEQRKSAERSLLEDRHLTNEERERLSGQLQQYTRTEASLEEQLKLYRDKQQLLRVVSPIEGEVITWQVRDRLLTRPVEKGQLLLTVADPKGKWDLEIHMPEDRMGHIARTINALHRDPANKDKNLPVSYIVATNPGASRQGVVTDVQKIAEVRGEEGNVVLVRVAINKDDLAADEIRPGATVNAKVDCGWASVGYVWFHDAISFVQSRILFHL